MELDNVKVGDYVTVTKGKTCTTGYMDSSYSGALLEVLAVSEPFVLCRELVSKFCMKSTSHPVLDMREWGLGKLEQKFIDAMLEVANRK